VPSLPAESCKFWSSASKLEAAVAGGLSLGPASDHRLEQTARRITFTRSSNFTYLLMKSSNNGPDKIYFFLAGRSRRWLQSNRVLGIPTHSYVVGISSRSCSRCHAMPCHLSLFTHQPFLYIPLQLCFEIGLHLVFLRYTASTVITQSQSLPALRQPIHPILTPPPICIYKQTSHPSPHPLNTSLPIIAHTDCAERDTTMQLAQ
jgi:hypothetical protein